MNKDIKVAIVHDWLTYYGGAERVVEQMHRAFPDAPVYTLVYDRKAMPDSFRSWDIRTTWMQRLPMANRLYKKLLIMMPQAYESFDLTEYDLVISSCTSCSKGVITRPDAVHVCYCNTPTRYVWDFYYQYYRHAGLLSRVFMPGMIHKVRMWDRLAADRVDWFVANSGFTASRVEKYYRRDAAVIYPGVDVSGCEICAEPDDYYIMVGRMAYYKRFDLGVEACEKLGRRLIVIGRGGDEERGLHSLAGNYTEFLGRVDDRKLREYYAHAKALLYPGEEDFGIIPVEAQSCGCPVIAYGRGGALETVLDGKTGLFFGEQSVDSLAECIERFEKTKLLPRSEIREHTLSFSEERFCRELTDFCESAVKDRRERKAPENRHLFGR